MSPRITSFALAAAVLVAIAGCTAAAPAPLPTETFVSDPAAVEEPAVLTPNPVDPDTTLIIRAVATADSGETLSLEMHVHQSIRWDDIASQTVPAALVDDCAGTLSAPMFADQSWSFTRATLTAIPPEGVVWPEAQTISVLPSADSVLVTGRGLLAHAAADSTPLCEQSKFVNGAGRGGLAIGVAGDADIFTRWAQHRFGFTVGEGVTLAECTIELTPLGATLVGGATWAPNSAPGDCSTGPAVEAVDR